MKLHVIGIDLGKTVFQLMRSLLFLTLILAARTCTSS
jgi:hypothetical protein